MNEILGYGEDALTLWALKQRTSAILDEFGDKTTPSNCLAFYRPSFGRHSKANSSVFGEFDAILASEENIYLIESKWDNLAEFNNDEIMLRDEQTLRHKILSWYLTHWNMKYYGNWENFVKEQRNDFQKEFGEHEKAIASNSLLAANLEFILTKSMERCKEISPSNIKNVLLFFHNANNEPPTKTSNAFKLIPIFYGKEIKGNFVNLFEDEKL